MTNETAAERLNRLRERMEIAADMMDRAERAYIRAESNLEKNDTAANRSRVELAAAKCRAAGDRYANAQAAYVNAE